MEYLDNGKLVIWLRDRYANDIADAIEQLDKNEQNLAKKVSAIFDVPYDEKVEEDLVKTAERAERIHRLKQYTDEKKFIEEIDNVAFDQDELYDLLDEDADKIYLCGDKFSIPLSKSGVSYVGINNPVAVIDSKAEVDWSEKEIALEGVIFDKKYQKIVQDTKKEDNAEKNRIIENSIDKIEIGENGILFTTKKGESILIQEKVCNLIDRSDKYAVFGKCEKGIVVVSLLSLKIVFNGNPQGGFGTYNGLTIKNDWLIWSEVSFNLQTGTKFLFRYDSLINGNISGFTVSDEKIIYVIGEYASKSPVSGWAFNFYTCDFEWKNAKKIISYSGSDGLFIDNLTFENGKVYFNYKVGHSYYAPKNSAFFDLATEEKNSILNVRREYLS